MITMKQENEETTCDSVVTVTKHTMWNIKRHIVRQHEDVWKEIQAAKEGS